MNNKTYAVLAAVILFSLLTFPLAAIKNDVETDASLPVAATVFSDTDDDSSSTMTLHLSEEDDEISLEISDYITGVVAAEMSAAYDSEALKAQAVASYTFYLFRKAENADQDYDITDSSLTDQSYLDEEGRREKWGDNFDENEEKIKDAVHAVLYQYIAYDGKPIFAAYHSISGGKTESAENIWGGSYPYLQPVESVADMLSPDYISTVTYTKDEFVSMAASLDIELEGEPADFLGDADCTESGTVKTYSLGGKSVTGMQMREAFSLRSANFDLAEKDGKLIFTVRGFGHGVGMSQYGANAMAQQGSDYKDILNWYYTDCEIKS